MMLMSCVWDINERKVWRYWKENQKPYFEGQPKQCPKWKKQWSTSEFEFYCRQGVLDTTLCDQVCQWLVTGRWFSLYSQVSSINKTDCHNITEILLKVALNTITLTLTTLQCELIYFQRNYVFYMKIAALIYLPPSLIVNIKLGSNSSSIMYIFPYSTCFYTVLGFDKWFIIIMICKLYVMGSTLLFLFFELFRELLLCNHEYDT